MESFVSVIDRISSGRQAVCHTDKKILCRITDTDTEGERKNYEKMSGIEKKQLQIDRGTRIIVENLDDVRCRYGFDRVIVHTPIVETRLRSGFIPLRPLILSYQVPDHSLKVQLTVPMTFPKSSLVCEVLDNNNAVNEEFGAIIAEKKLNDLQSFSDAISAAIDEIHKNSPTITDEIITNDTIDGSRPDIIDDEPTVEEENVVFYCCRNCRYCLADSSQNNDHSKSCSNSTSVFLEEPPAFFDAKDAEEGKLLCPKCQGKVGTWSWIGSKCSCGEWIVPAYQIPKSKIDIKTYS